MILYAGLESVCLAGWRDSGHTLYALVVDCKWPEIVNVCLGLYAVWRADSGPGLYKVFWQVKSCMLTEKLPLYKGLNGIPLKPVSVKFGLKIRNQ